jgi:hypothetical protein
MPTTTIVSSSLATSNLCRSTSTLILIPILLFSSLLSLPADSLTGRQFIGFTNFPSIATVQTSSNQTVWTSPDLRPDIAWNQLILSWNVSSPQGASLIFEAAPIFPNRPITYFNLGYWSADPSAPELRRSVTGQLNDQAHVLTDILTLHQPATHFRIRVTSLTRPDSPPPDLRFLGAALLNSQIPNPLPPPPFHEAWSRTLPVPSCSQLDYQGGDAWCSPTSLSMVLHFWASHLHRPDLLIDVPQIAEAVHDPNWPGTGNWSFNTAFAGSLNGLRSYVTRLAFLSELEAWLLTGVPVIASVSYSILKGEPDLNDGHLVVCVGFTGDGQIILNDPGSRLQPRKTIPRERFINAWSKSHRTVYLVYPIHLVAPHDQFSHWFPPPPATPPNNSTP